MTDEYTPRHGEYVLDTGEGGMKVDETLINFGQTWKKVSSWNVFELKLL